LPEDIRFVLIGLDLGFTQWMIAIPALLALNVIVKFFEGFPAIAPVLFSIIALRSPLKVIARTPHAAPPEPTL
jgi:hypothetical protein